VKIVVFTHSLRSCWNHGNAHFLRGVLRELTAAGHRVAAYEPDGAWSVENLLRDHGEAGLAASLAPYPELSATVFDASLDLDAALDGADAVLAHEWNEPDLVARIGRARRCGGRFTLLFHDTHHRAVSDPDAIRRFDLDGYDGVLAFGETLAAVYRRWGWGDRVFVWHEAADTRLFHPPEHTPSPRPHPESPVENGRPTPHLILRSPAQQGVSKEGSRNRAASGSLPESSPGRALRDGPLRGPPQDEVGGRDDHSRQGSEEAQEALWKEWGEEARQRQGLVWIGNWGDGERSAELESFLFRPARSVGLPLDVYGVRYPDDALAALARYGAQYRGWLPNARAPETFARHLATVHVPRRFYVERLPGIPTIRVFEALACGIPLVCAPWRDSENLFRPGKDYLVAPDEATMERHLAALRDDPDLRRSLARSGLETIRARHTCAHRARELIDILHGLRASAPMEASA
jgi:spore maturation protein CgeB